MERQARANKLLLLGVDGMDPRLTRKYVGKGGISNHTGVDIALPKGTPIHALNDGVVLYTRYGETGYGYHVVINHHGGYATLYGHCSEILVSAGQTVTKGQVIAKVGTTGNSTGNHLHVEIIENGQPLNPEEYLP